MATTTIPWSDGSGDNIYLTYPSASGDQTVTVSSDANAGTSSRTQTVTFTAGSISKALTVIQAANLIPVFYDWLLFDGTAYIDTDIYPQQDSVYAVPCGGEKNLEQQRLFAVGTSEGTYIRAFLNSSTNTTSRSFSLYYNSSSSLANVTVNWNNPAYNFFMTPNGAGYGDQFTAYTKGSGSPDGILSIGTHDAHSGYPYSGAMGIFKIYTNSAEDVVAYSDLSSYTPYKTLKPCEYGGNAGLWNEEESKFYGNSAGSGTITACSRKAANPSSYDSSNYSYYSLSNASNAYASYSSTTYAQINLKTGSGAETYIFFNFDVSSIPADATILRVVCSAKASCNQVNSNTTSRTLRLYSGTTAKGSATSIDSNSGSGKAYLLSAGTWTRSELNNIRIRVYAKRGTSNVNNTGYYLRFFGATLHVYWK